MPTAKVCGSIGNSRREADFVAFLDHLFASAPAARWEVVYDNLNTQMAEGVIRLVADLCGINEELGEKGKSSTLRSMPTREALLRDASRRITFTLKYASWINQIEIWFSIRATFAKRMQALARRLRNYAGSGPPIASRLERWTEAGPSGQTALPEHVAFQVITADGVFLAAAWLTTGAEMRSLALRKGAVHLSLERGPQHRHLIGPCIR